MSETVNDLDQLACLLVSEFLGLAESNPIACRNFFIGGIVGNLVGNMPEKDWIEFIRREPCGRPGCDCHLKFDALFKGVQELREDHKLHCDKSISE